jgi:uncharacterized membrane protein (DUF106 family)
MDKREFNAITFLLCLVIGILLVLMFLFLLEDRKMKGELKNSTRENQKAALVLREEREKLERVLKQLKEKESD